MKWQSILNIGEEFELYEEDKISPAELGKRVAEKVKQNRFYEQCDELQTIVFNLEESVSDIEDFDSVLDDLYDFGDTLRRIWVQTAVNRSEI